MLQDMDGEMRRRGLDALIVIGDGTYNNPELYYVVGAHVPRGGIYLKKAFEPPLLLVNSMDLSEAKRGRVKEVKAFSDYGYERLLKAHGAGKALPLLLKKVFKERGVSGRIALAGRSELSKGLRLADELKALGYRVVGEARPTLLESLMETKEPKELRRIKAVAEKAAKVVEETIDFLSGLKPRGKFLFRGGRKVTVGDVKRRARLLLSEEGLVPSEGLIFSVGPKSARPHYQGEDRDPLAPNRPIIFDLFPREPGGYFADITRTFVVGKAPRRVKAIHQAVLEAQRVAAERLRPGAKAKDVAGAVCGFFEKLGYPTVRSAPKAMRGFIHALGHGVGLTIGDRPALSPFSQDEIKVGNVVTIEPGLYFPRVGGVRVEDTVSVTKAGPKTLTKLTRELEII
ncbi:TPA: aminopeptidase P family protein [Candidatus Bathyarchaeota archaeon]|nr:aminopeptidase P family protein [Candidatus Bathyarchaeota archaeon]